MAIERDMKLLTASDVAELCEVDLKTIHNWVERGCIPHFRTPGRHLRFQATDVAKFLRDWGYAIPKRFYAEIAQTIVVVGDKESTAHVSRAAGPTATLRTVEDLYAALLLIGAEPTSAVVVDALVVRSDPEMVASALRAISRAFSQMPVVILGEHEAAVTAGIKVVAVGIGDAKALRAALTREGSEAPAQAPGTEPARPRRKPRSDPSS